jgi:hypothetical protein
VCDVAENCTGSGANCPADAFAPSSTVCRPSSGTCDLAESCTGTSATCPADTGQPDGDGDGTCDAIDNCVTIANPSQANGDSDPLGDACDPCTNIVPTGAIKQKLVLSKLLPPSTDDKLSLKSFFTSMPSTPTINPIANGLRVLISDSMGNIPVDVTVPGGAYDAGTRTGWKVNGAGTAWTFRTPNTVLANGIIKAQVRAIPSTPGKYKVGVKGKDGNYPVNPANLPLVGTVVIDVPLAATGQCGDATFTATPPARPSCTQIAGKTIKCK